MDAIAAIIGATQRIRQLAAQDAPVPNAVLATLPDGTPVWRVGSAMQVWTLDSNAIPGWRALPLLGSVAYQQPVQAQPAPQGGLVSISVGTLLNLTAGMNSLQTQVEALRAKLNEEIAAREALNAELRRVNLMRSQ